MTENDKILIHAYLDGETSEDESKYIESLLKSNNEANEFANNIKRANTEINSYFNSSESKDLEFNIDKFIEKQKKKSAKSLFSFNNFFSNPRYYGLAATAIIFFGIGTQFTDSGFRESNLEFKYLVLRSENNELQLTMIISEMIEKEISTANIDSDLYNQIVISQLKNSDCFLFELSGKATSIGKYCLETNYIKINDID